MPDEKWSIEKQHYHSDSYSSVAYLDYRRLPLQAYCSVRFAHDGIQCFTCQQNEVQDDEGERGKLDQRCQCEGDARQQVVYWTCETSLFGSYTEQDAQ